MVITAELKSIHSPDVADMYSYRPTSEAFNIFIELYIGIPGEKGEEQFGVEVCSLKWIEHELSRDAFVIPRNRIVSIDFNIDKIIGEVNRIIMLCSGNNWNEIATKLSRWFRWEFENYEE